MPILFLLPILFACRTDKLITTVNSSPEATITSHSDGDTVLQGFIESMRAQVSDSNHAAEELEAAWYYGDQLVCDWEAPDSGGATSCDFLIEVEVTAVRLEVRDPEGAGAFDEVTLTVQPTDAPTAEILSPEVGGVYYSDQKVIFEGLVSDNEDQPEELVVNWNSDIDGDLGVADEVNGAGEVVGAAYLEEAGLGLFFCFFIAI